MKKLIFLIFSATVFFSNTTILRAQNLSSAGDYISAVNAATIEMHKTYVAYIYAAAHHEIVGEIEKMRRQTIDDISDCKHKIIKMPVFNKDSSLRNSIIDYMDLCYGIFNDDYGHIVNVEETNEQSIDQMKEYLLLREKTNEHLRNISAAFDSAEKIFAAKYHAPFADTTSTPDAKMDTANSVAHYRDGVYMIFYKCNWENKQLARAIDIKNRDTMEQARNMLINYTKEGLAVLDTLKPFNDDLSLINACKNALILYKSIGENDVPKLTDAMLEGQNFDKIKAAYDAGPQTKTKADIDGYNKAANDANAALDNYKAADNKRNNSTTQALQEWSDGEKNFFDVQIPYYKEQKK